MVNVLKNKLFQFEITREGFYKELFLFYLASDIMELLEKVRDRGLRYQLTGHELEVANNVEEYYKSMSFLRDAII